MLADRSLNIQEDSKVSDTSGSKLELSQLNTTAIVLEGFAEADKQPKVIKLINMRTGLMRASNNRSVSRVKNLKWMTQKE